jgi:hypothetical protein
MLLVHQIMELADLADDDRGAVRRVIASDGCRIGLAPVARDPLRHAVARNRFRQKAPRRMTISLHGQEAVDGLTISVHGAVEVAPLPAHPEVRFIHPPAEPGRPLAAVERRFQLRALLQDPWVNRGVITRHAAFLPHLLQGARAQGIRHVPAHARQDKLYGTVGSLKADHHFPPSEHSG